MRELARSRFQRLSNHPRPSAAASQFRRVANSRRHIQIQATPSSDSSGLIEQTPDSASTPDAVFEVIGTPYSLLSVSLSASQPLHTRRGTLVGLSGDASTAVSTLRLLSPLRRALAGIPFLYQRLTATTPITALISPKTSCTSLAVLHLTGTTDWKIAQRKGLLAWTGNTLTLTPSLNRHLGLAHWGSTTATGRGLLALAGSGNLFSLDLAENETYLAHPSNILAYSISSSSTTTTPPPQPYRLRSSALNLQIPRLPYNFLPLFPSSRLLTNLRNSDTYLFLSRLAHSIRTWSRRTIWGDRLFLHFTGPTTILLQSRGSRVRDVLTNREVDEMADAPPGAVAEALKSAQMRQRHEEGDGRDGEAKAEQKAPLGGATAPKPLRLSIASVQRDGKVRIEETRDFEQLKT